MRGHGYTRSVRRILLAVAVALLSLLPAPVRGQDSVVATTLDNGLRVLLLEDHRSPIVSFQTWYRVGSRNEARGATGIAHFLEHLMFRGTPTNGPGVYARTVERNGGQDNAFTSQDVTSYYVDIAADRLDLVLALEAGGDYSYFSFDPNLFWFWATPLPGQTPETMEKELLGEMDRLRKEPVGDEELKRAKNQIEAAFVFQEDSVHRRAALLARFELIGGFGLKDQYLDKIRAVTAADLQRVAQKYFGEDKKNVGILLPKPQ